MFFYQLCVNFITKFWNISNVLKINLMHVIVTFWMMTWSNTVVYSCECGFFLFCFPVLSCECIFLCVLCCLMFIDMFYIQMQLMQRLDQWNEYVCMYFFLINNFIKQHVPLQGSNTTCWRFLYISVVLCCTICAINYLLVFCFSAYSSCILFPYFADVFSLPLTIINSLFCAGYKVSKFIEFTDIWNHLVCLFARSELDRGQFPPVCLLYPFFF
jgi:hypothetical protein